MGYVFLRDWILAVKVASAVEQLVGRDFPSTVILFAHLPPSEAFGELCKLNGCGLGVVLAPCR